MKNKAISDRQIQLLVAEECGFTAYDENLTYGFVTATGKACQVQFYIGSLDAMHDAEETLTPDQREQFYCFLMELLPCDENHGPAGEGLKDVMVPSSFTMVHAGPLERAIAFLLVKGRLDIEEVRMRT